MLRIVISLIALAIVLEPAFAGEDWFRADHEAQKLISEKSIQEAKALIVDANSNARLQEKRAAEIIKDSKANQNIPGNIEWFEELHLAEIQNPISLGFQDAELTIFVSLSMPKPLLINLARDAKAYGATLVLRGLKQDSYMETALYLQDLIRESGVGFIIDPSLFEKYKVSRVPEFVLRAPASEVYDKVIGNVDLRFALEEMAQKGDLAEAAKQLLGARK